MKELNEPLIDDNYPVFWDYLYVADGKVIRSDVAGTVRNLKRDLISQGISCKEVRKCDISGRREATHSAKQE